MEIKLDRAAMRQLPDVLEHKIEHLLSVGKVYGREVLDRDFDIHDS